MIPAEQLPAPPPPLQAAAAAAMFSFLVPGPATAASGFAPLPLPRLSRAGAHLLLVQLLPLPGRLRTPSATEAPLAAGSRFPLAAAAASSVFLTEPKRPPSWLTPQKRCAGPPRQQLQGRPAAPPFKETGARPAASLRRRPRTEAGAELPRWRERRRQRRRDAGRAGDGPGLPRASLHAQSCERGAALRPSRSVFVISPAPSWQGAWSPPGPRRVAGFGPCRRPGLRPEGLVTAASGLDSGAFSSGRGREAAGPPGARAAGLVGAAGLALAGRSWKHRTVLVFLQLTPRSDSSKTSVYHAAAASIPLPVVRTDVF